MSPLTSQVLLWVVLPLIVLLCVRVTAWSMRATAPEGGDPFADPCVCGHVPGLHEHFRRGMECAGYGCECEQYEPEILAQVQR